MPEAGLPEVGMLSKSARRELGFVLAVAAAGLALVLVVVFAPTP